MNRRQWLRLGSAASIASHHLQGWQEAPPYPGVSYRQYAHCLPAYLRELALAAYKRRNDDLAKVTTPEAAAERRRWARQKFWSLIGGQPERNPLNARVTGTVDRTDYRLDKVVFESRAGFYVTGNLYVPLRGRRPMPAVLVQMGHAPQGKAYPSYQRLCQGLARLGFVAFGFDPMGQGERIYYPDASGKRTRVGSVDDEHSTGGRQMLLTGDTATRLQAWDAVRAIDYLVSLPFVDRTRIGTTGQSGGATNSMMLVALDDRVAVAALSSAINENFACAGFNSPGSTDDAEQNFLDSGPNNFDRWDLLYPFAPKPLLISVSDKDYFGTYSPQYIASGWEEFQKLKNFYGVLGKPEHIAWASTPLPHSLAYDSRLQIYNWFIRWFRPDAKPVAEEPRTQPETEESLLCTESGSAVRSLNSLTPYLMNKRRLGRTSPVPLERLLRLDRPPAQTYQTLRRTLSRGVEIEALDIPSAPHVSLPAWLFLPRPARAPRTLFIILDPSGRNTDWHEDELYQSLALQGFAVCVPDLRGLGDLMPEMGPGNPRHARSHNEEEAYAWASLILGKPMLGQRVSDILSVVRAAKAHPALQNRPVFVAAQGKVSVPAQCASALTPAINRLYISGGLSSFRSVVETENYGHAFANFIPGLLEHTDLPDITAQSQARRIVLAGLLDGGGRRLPADDVRKLYERTRNLEVLEPASWNIESLVRAATAP
ncbi:MAG TPA: acetylxylan esterase [Bryobacteraceae bacterium]|nr:acetylxylan esterase [Bryobacteraceae bacterium]